jgi:hypothetical protein
MTLSIPSSSQRRRGPILGLLVCGGSGVYGTTPNGYRSEHAENFWSVFHSRGAGLTCLVLLETMYIS